MNREENIESNKPEYTEWQISDFASESIMVESPEHTAVESNSVNTTEIANNAPVHEIITVSNPKRRNAISKQKKLYIAMFSIHGLVRGNNLELGRDADTGGQIKYVVELAHALSERSDVERVDLFTRQVFDSKIDLSYAEPEEQIAPCAWIVRAPCGPRRYLRKEVLWPHLDQFADQVLKHFRRIGRLPDILHGHYADAGYVASRLSNLLGIPMVFTGHSLGRVKKARLLEKGIKKERISARYNINIRIEAEENALETASLVVASTNQEVKEQYSIYEHYQPNRKVVIPPGIDLERFHAPRRLEHNRSTMQKLQRFLQNPAKPMILALSRPDERKNITGLIRAYAENSYLKDNTNLVIVAGTRDDIETMDSGSRDVLKEILYLIDKYDLYGSVAYPKHHEQDDIPSFYRAAAKTKGVFVNPALTEPFGITLLEASASGVPIVATHDGGPSDIIGNCENGCLVDPLDHKKISEEIVAIVSNPSQWKSYSKNGLRGVKRHYSWSGHAQTYCQKIRKLVKPKRTKNVLVPSGKRLLEANRLLITDIDDTLLINQNSREDKAKAQEALHELLRRMSESPLKVGFGIATGRSVESALQVLEEWNVPRPDILITSVGSEIHYGAQMEMDDRWPQHIRHRWQPDRLRECLKDIPGITLQPDENQRPFKVSYYVDSEKAPARREIVRHIRKHKLHTRVIYSHNQFLDLLPQRASKGLAIWYLANRWGIPMEWILVAGDSGNDEDMLTSSALGVVVGNYSSELEKLKSNPNIYFAQSDCASGILEGVEHYGFLQPKVDDPEEIAA